MNDWKDTIGFTAYKLTDEYYLGILNGCASVQSGLLFKFLDAVRQHYAEGDEILAIVFAEALENVLEDSIRSGEYKAATYIVNDIQRWINYYLNEKYTHIRLSKCPELREDLTEADRPELLLRLTYLLKYSQHDWVKSCEKGKDIVRDADKRLAMAKMLINNTETSINLAAQRLAELDEKAINSAITSSAQQKQPQVNGPKSDLTLLSPADRILAPGFTLDEADLLAHAVGLTDEAGNYCLGPRKLGAVVGFALALQRAGRLVGAIPDLTDVLAPRWSVQIKTRKTTTGIAEHYYNLTTKRLDLPKKTD